MVCASRAMDDCTATLPVVIYLRTFVLSLACYTNTFIYMVAAEGVDAGWWMVVMGKTHTKRGLHN